MEQFPQVGFALYSLDGSCLHSVISIFGSYVLWAIPLFFKSEHFPWLASVSLSALAHFLLQFSLSSQPFMTSYF